MQCKTMYCTTPVLLLAALAPRRIVPRLNERTTLLSYSEHCLLVLQPGGTLTYVLVRRPPCRSGKTRLFLRRAPWTPLTTHGAQRDPAVAEDDARTHRGACRAASRRCPTCQVSFIWSMSGVIWKYTATPALGLTCWRSSRRSGTTNRRHRRGTRASQQGQRHSVRRVLAGHKLAAPKML